MSKTTGRPSDFKREYVEQARKLALLGLTVEEMAGVFDVTKRTLLTWQKKHKALDTAIRKGRTMADADVAASLYERACGYSHPEVVLHQHNGVVIKTRVTKHYPPDTQAATKWLHNRDPKRWKATVDPSDADGDVPQPVKVVIEVKSGRVRPDDADPQRPAG